MRSAVLAVVTCFAGLDAFADAYRVDETRWSEAVRAASAAGKPIVVFFRPADCSSRGIDPCDTLAKVVAHPAMQRRLSDVVFLTETVEGVAPAIAVYDPAGLEAKRWHTVPDVTDFAKILNLIEIASPYLVGTPSPRTSALAALAFGDETRGRTRLEALHQSSIGEDRELATIWLTRLRAKVSQEELDRLTELGARGTTEMVRFEAWMAAGDVHAANDRADKAIEAYGHAAQDAPGALNRTIALTALHRIAETSSPVLGLGSANDLVFGRRTIQPRKPVRNAARVEVRLDGRLVATSRVAPFVCSLDFGRIPKRQTLTLTVIDKAGDIVQRSNVIVNERGNAFSVQIVEPASTVVSGEIDVEVATRVPRATAIESVVVEWDGAPIASFSTPPYRARVSIPSEMGILRAVLRLTDGSETEDVRLMNSRDLTLESEVNLIEIPAYLETAGVTAETLVLREAGKPRTIDRLIPATDTPLRIALVLDASNSMKYHMLDLQEAAVQFVEHDVGPRDDTMVIGFGSSLQILQPTRRRPHVERAILRLYANGPTPLHDAMITALLRLQVSGSRRALVVFSDGMDTCSVFSARDVAEVARRIGVPIYVLSFAPDVSVASLRHSDRVAAAAHGDLVRLSRTSGGKAFRLRSLEELGKIWNEIGADLRKQSLVVYRTDPDGEEWRPLALSIRGGREVRAPSGVYVGADR